MRTIYVDKNIPRLLLVKALKGFWSGIVFSSISPARMAEWPEPPLPGARWLRVHNRLCGICASDLALLFAEADARVAPAALPGNQRFYLGHEALGIVTEVGAQVQALKPGDRVIMDTRFQGANCLSQEIELVCRHCAAGNYSLCENASAGIGPRGVGGGWGDGFTAHETEVFRVPADLNDEQAVMIEPLSTGMRAVLRRMPAAGQRALIVGAGIIGLNTLQCLRVVAPACHISIMARYRHQSELAARLGADEVITAEDGYRATARITGAKLYEGLFSNRMLLGGFDVVYDCVGSRQTLGDSLRWARAGGAVVLVGVKLAPYKIDLTPIWYQEVELLGIYAHGSERQDGETLPTFERVVQYLRQGKLPIDGLITHRFPLSRWREAVATAIDKRSGAVKVIFDYGITC